MAETPRELARQRIKELAELRARLEVGEPITRRDTNEVEARAAEFHDQAARGRIGDLAGHRRVAAGPREAATDDLRAVLESKRRAKRKR